MASLPKQDISPIHAETPESFVSQFETQLQAMNQPETVELLYKKLQYLGLHFDPFDSESTSEVQEVISNLGLAEQFRNPYQATNLLLRLLDKTEEQLNKLKQ
jgi:hypothetical protein